MRVVVIGAGIGGLTLAHALRGVGIAVRVHDRDARAEDTGGYRLHLDPRAAAVLARRLPPTVHRALLASAVDPATFRQFGVFDHRLRLLLALPRDEPGDAVLIGRIPLRRLLTEGLDDAIRWEAEFVRAERHADGTVTAHFADGSTDRGDLLVGADGARSRVASALAGRPTARPVGAAGLAGRTALTPATRRLIPEALGAGPAFALGPHGIGMFLSVHDPAAGTIVDPATCHDVPAQLEDGYLLWAITAADARYPAGTARLDAPGRQAVAGELLRGWSPDMLALVAAADVGSITYYGLLAADPDADPTPWPAGVVTALGDAVHAMPPTGGRGAATAIRDADLLATELAAAASGTTTVTRAVQAFEAGMASYAAEAVRTSLAPLTWQRRMSGRLAYPVARAGLAAWGALRTAPWRSCPPGGSRPSRRRSGRPG